ncbi:protein shisa-5 isoform X1 [Peromyscus leucopus]|uniref:protein shisa-5 isoform X1 n=2 Tax=Peromyscus leucopus TaxID=10041 RepID=UPI0010A1A398|nr:protein shisa-5 isoform X1 [Peromyscus leucopus]
MAAPASSPRTLLLLLLLLLPPPGALGELCRLVGEDNLILESCPDFCCGSCSSQYCCSDVQKRVSWDEDACTEPEASRFSTHPETLEQLGSALRFRSSFDSDHMSGFGATVAIGVTIFVVFIATIIICFTCSCCCLYKMCCNRPRPVVTNTTTTTVVHTPYPQPPSVAPSYPGPTYQGYHPMPPQPGMPTAPYPTQYPPPYLAQPVGPPAYHESLAGGSAAPYSASQPPYNPAYVDPPKAVP